MYKDNIIMANWSYTITAAQLLKIKTNTMMILVAIKQQCIISQYVGIEADLYTYKILLTLPTMLLLPDLCKPLPQTIANYYPAKCYFLHSEKYGAVPRSPCVP